MAAQRRGSRIIHRESYKVQPNTDVRPTKAVIPK
jgi:hypothetical protein